MKVLNLLQQDYGFITLDWQYFGQFEIPWGNQQSLTVFSSFMKEILGIQISLFRIQSSSPQPYTLACIS
jgi:hypothetical protein